MRMPANIRRTMAITTGTKSLALCLTIIAVSFPESEYLKYLAFPELHSVMMMAEFTAYCAGYKVYVWLGKGFNAQAHTKNASLEVLTLKGNAKDKGEHNNYMIHL